MGVKITSAVTVSPTLFLILVYVGLLHELRQVNWNFKKMKQTNDQNFYHQSMTSVIIGISLCMCQTISVPLPFSMF